MKREKRGREKYLVLNHDDDPDYTPVLSAYEKKAIESGQPMTLISFDDEHQIAHEVSFNMDKWPPPEMIQLFAERLFNKIKKDMDAITRENER